MLIEFAVAIIVLVAILLILQKVPGLEPYKGIIVIVIGALVAIYLLLWIGALVGYGPGPPRLLTR